MLHSHQSGGKARALGVSPAVGGFPAPLARAGRGLLPAWVNGTFGCFSDSLECEWTLWIPWPPDLP